MKNIITNIDKINTEKLQIAKEIIAKLQNELPEYIERGHGPFLAAVYQNDKLIAKCANTVVMDNCSNHHAEINAIRAGVINVNANTAKALQDIRNGIALTKSEIEAMAPSKIVIIFVELSIISII